MYMILASLKTHVLENEQKDTFVSPRFMKGAFQADLPRCDLGRAR